MRRAIGAAVVAAALAASGPTFGVVGGRMAGEGEFPWTAAVYSGRSPSSGQFCGGTLVAPTVVVSAKHCVWEMLNNTAALVPGDPFRFVDPLRARLRVMVGSRYLSGDDAAEHRAVDRVHASPNEDLDVAVLVFETPASIHASAGPSTTRGPPESPWQVSVPPSQ